MYSHFCNGILQKKLQNFLLFGTRDARFLEENQETGNKGPGNFLQEMKDQENQEKS